MSTEKQSTSTSERPTERSKGLLSDRTISGLLLIVIGVIIVISRLVPGTGDYVLLAVGVTCLVAFIATREYGFAVATGITGGLGVGVVLAANAQDPTDGVLFMASLAGGFLAIWILGFFADPQERNPWPLIPAAILAALAVSIATDNPGLIDWLIVAVAVVLVLAGLRAVRANRTSRQSAA